MLNTIYVISNMHLNYNLSIHPVVVSLLKKSHPFVRVRVWVQSLYNFFFFSFSGAEE
jgi:hypothetical protein